MIRIVLINPATLAAGLMVAGIAVSAAELTPENRDFFESKIRPVLVNECYECHSTAGKQRGGLVLDHRAALLAGGDSGPVIVPGEPEASLLLAAIRHERDDLKMPKAGIKLSPEVVENFTRWVARGAPDPRDAPPSAAELAAASDWQAVMEQRKQWWSFQPIADADVPGAKDASSPAGALDRFLRAKQEEAGLPVAGAADKQTLIRRLSLVLTGLPPSPRDVQLFEENAAPDAYNALVDALLDSPAFGERWARHWMDWFRYAESHGSEGDPSIPFAWRYRDYLIRALNADVPYDQLVREHLAGDLLESPRIEDGHNESALGTGHYRMVQHGFAPTDALDEMVRFTDNQVDVITKGFLGLTVSCARCHNHKFDAISQADFYALFGIMASCRPATVSVDGQEPVDGPRAVMQRMKGLIRERLAAAWRTEPVADHLLRPEAPWASAIENATGPGDPLHAWSLLRDKEGAAFVEGWKELRDEWQAGAEELERQQSYPYEHRWRLGSDAAAAEWFAHGTGTRQPPGSARAGDFHLHEEGEQVVGGIFPGALLSHALTTRDSAVFESPKVMLDGKFRAYVRVIGAGRSLARYVVRHYPRDGTVYPVGRLDGGSWRWLSWDLDYWSGDTVHLEFATAADSPVLGSENALRSWVALREAVLVREGEPAPREHLAETVTPLFAAAGAHAPASARELADQYARVVTECVTRWQAGTLTDPEAMFLNHLVGMNLLPNTLDGLPSVAPLVAEFRELERRASAPTRAPGIVEAEPVMQPLFERGDHKLPGDPVPRRFLDAFGARVYPAGDSGRRELAEDMVAANPLAARVIVNRLWHHVFGRGIVATTDNFGRLGSLPTHPELLDFLARWMQDNGWSVKKLIRLLVTSEAFQRGATPPPGAAERDPQNLLLSHWSVRRLEAEAIRDSILAASGRLDATRFGPPAAGDSGRRSVYVRVIRNNLDPFLGVFDAPVPNSTQGVRDASNVPAQSLTMLNDPFVIDAARAWAERTGVVEDKSVRVRQMFQAALGRKPTGPEEAAALAFVGSRLERMKQVRARVEAAEAIIARARAELAGLVDPVRARLVAAKQEAAGTKSEPALDTLQPAASWDFREGGRDQAGNLHLELEGGARITEEGLAVDGSGAFAVSAPLQKPLREKTLEALVQLSRLDQNGGGVMSVETLDGRVFDAIVYAERNAGEWMAGSDTFARTRDFGGSAEADEATRAPVWVTIVYGADGMITGYRNGRVYGKSYASGGPVTFEAGKARVLFGLRHSPSAGDRLLEGRIHRARLYDRALTPAEVLASMEDAANPVSSAEIDAAMSDAGRARRRELENAISAARAEREQWDADDAADLLRPWAELAHSIFNLKEFIYLK